MVENLESQWSDHKEELIPLRDENLKLERRMKQLERQNQNLMNRVKQLEDARLENNVIIQGITDAARETEEI